MNPQETFYVLEDGSICDPHDAVSNDKGKLFHQDGRPVAYNNETPRSRSVDAADVEKHRASKKKPDDNEKKPSGKKDMQPESGGTGYKTREAKSRK